MHGVSAVRTEAVMLIQGQETWKGWNGETDRMSLVQDPSYNTDEEHRFRFDELPDEFGNFLHRRVSSTITHSSILELESTNWLLGRICATQTPRWH